MLDRKEEATARLEKLAKDNPARWEPMEALGQLSWRKGDIEGARAWMRKAVERKPDDWNIYWNLRQTGIPERFGSSRGD